MQSTISVLVRSSGYSDRGEGFVEQFDALLRGYGYAGGGGRDGDGGALVGVGVGFVGDCEREGWFATFCFGFVGVGWVFHFRRGGDYGRGRRAREGNRMSLQAFF